MSVPDTETDPLYKKAEQVIEQLESRVTSRDLEAVWFALRDVAEQARREGAAVMKERAAEVVATLSVEEFDSWLSAPSQVASAIRALGEDA